LKKLIITVDGPAGSGKGKISKYISSKYKLKHLDSGVLYRRVAFLLLKENINLKNRVKISTFLDQINYISMRQSKILRTEQISKISSKIAKLHSVRNFVNFQQRKIVENSIKNKGFVIDGRDIGSVVFKKAKIKLYIQVNEKIRAERRHKQLIDIGEKSIYPKILKEIKLRDKKDKTRKISPLVIPKGAYIIDNSHSFRVTIKKIREVIGKL
tara:strand:- start:9970 stop:10605 length:636 start_codon:yes stop_codon:yes gene_type:complete